MTKTISRMRYSKSFERDYAFYLFCLDEFNFAGKLPPIVVESAAGLTAKECFYDLDSRGILHPCREPEMLRRLMITKASINLHVKMWAHALAMGTDTLDELRRNVIASFPSWVEKAVIRQAYKKGWLSDAYARNQVGLYRSYI